MENDLYRGFRAEKRDEIRRLLHQITPVERYDNFVFNGYGYDTVYLKREDLFTVAGVYGGKVRSCLALSQHMLTGYYNGLTTAGSRSSPQVNIVAHIAKFLDVECVAHTPCGELNEELILAQQAGAKIIQHKPGHNSVIIARSRQYADKHQFYDIPFGMENRGAVLETSIQVANIPDEVKRIVMPVGSGMSMAGVLNGLVDTGRDIPVLGVVVGADPTKRLDRFKPYMHNNYRLVNAGVDYHQYVHASVGGVMLDPVYEAKCVKFLEPGDLLWCVGIRQSYKPPA